MTCAFMYGTLIGTTSINTQTSCAAMSSSGQPNAGLIESYASSCCSDGLSSCAKFSNVCNTPTNYLPTKIFTSTTTCAMGVAGVGITGVINTQATCAAASSMTTVGGGSKLMPLAILASVCCSDGISSCAPFIPNPCLNPNDFTPSKVFGGGDATSTCSTYNTYLGVNLLNKAGCLATVPGSSPPSMMGTQVAYVASGCCSGKASACSQQYPSICSGGVNDFLPTAQLGSSPGFTCEMALASLMDTAGNSIASAAALTPALCSQTISSSSGPEALSTTLAQGAEACCGSKISACASLPISVVTKLTLTFPGAISAGTSAAVKKSIAATICAKLKPSTACGESNIQNFQFTANRRRLSEVRELSSTTYSVSFAFTGTLGSTGVSSLSALSASITTSLSANLQTTLAANSVAVSSVGAATTIQVTTNAPTPRPHKAPALAPTVNVGAIVGGVIGGAAGLVIIIALIAYIMKRSKTADDEKAKAIHVASAVEMQTPNFKPHQPARSV
jgi:hypothetical protein